MPESLSDRVRATVRSVPDFPTPGIIFKDITPVLADSAMMAEVMRAMSAPFADEQISHVVAIESRGFLFGAPIAMLLHAALVPARKPGKLPRRTEREAYALEYRDDVLEMHADALSERARVLIVDDVLATGGTAAAAARLVQRLGGTVKGLSVLGELTFLGGRSQFGDYPVHAVAQF